jgi:hypothetical protein
VTYSHIKRGLRKMSIGIAVSLDGSCKKDYKIVMMHTSGSMVTLITWGSTKRVGTNYIPHRVLKQMFENNGQRVIEVNMGIGDKRQLLELKERDQKRRNKEQND